jgi:DtxR family Mn-dependent transcriptional regulator
MVTATVEDYVKAIYAHQRESATGDANVAKVAVTLGVTNGTVTSMMHKLKQAGYANAEKYGGIRLTAKGTKLALDVIRRHRLIEVFLVDVLKFDWTEVHDEAERLEHAMSKKLIERLDAFLGHPRIDPHGDPIPDANGRLTEVAVSPLNKLQKDTQGTIARVNDQDPAFLTFAAKHGLKPGANFLVLDAVPEAQSISVQAAGGKAVALSFVAAQHILVHPRTKP